MKTALQLPLDIQTDPEPDLSNFYAGKNHEALEFLQNFELQEQHFCYLWGESGSGVSFLLKSLSNKLHAPYVSMSSLADLSIDLLVGLGSLPVICIDHVDHLHSKPEWQEALFHCLNVAWREGNKVVMAGQQSPRNLSLELEDLKSRISWGQIFRIQKLDDQELQQALIEKASLKGLQLDDSVAQYLLTHYSRDLQHQFKQLDQLDKASLTHQRKLSIHFVKQVLPQ